MARVKNITKYPVVIGPESWLPTGKQIVIESGKEYVLFNSDFNRSPGFRYAVRTGKLRLLSKDELPGDGNIGRKEMGHAKPPMVKAKAKSEMNTGEWAEMMYEDRCEIWNTLRQMGERILDTQGPAGKDGKNGINGKDGKNGEPGPTGPTGEMGPMGATGPLGPEGVWVGLKTRVQILEEELAMIKETMSKPKWWELWKITGEPK